MEVINKPVLVGVAGALVCVSCFQFLIEDAGEKLALVSVNTFIVNSYVWNIVTCPFYESNIGKLIVELPMFAYLFRELNFPSLEQFGVYLVGSILCASLSSAGFAFVRFFVTHSEAALLVQTHGFGGIFITFALFARQQFGNRPLIETIPFLTYNNLPIVVLLLQSIALLIGFGSLATDISLTLFSLLFGWSYLRFYYKFNLELAELGDKSEGFSFVAMFPLAFQPIVVPFTTAFYNLGSMVGIYPELEVVEKKLQHHLRYIESPVSNLEAGLLSADSSAGIPQDAVQERRRAKAMKLLDAKMAELSSEGNGWDDKDDDITPPPANYSSGTPTSLVGALDSGVKRPSSIELSHIKI